MTYYKQFAEMLGLELEQEFNLVTNNMEKSNSNTYKIKEDGLYCESATHEYWFVASSEYLDILLEGEFKAVPKPWRPKDGEAYWYWGASSEFADLSHWGGTSSDFALWKLGNCFRTENEAKTKGKEIMEQLKKEYEEE